MLQKRGDIYLSRVTVPADLRPILGRLEILRSLRTGDRREASHRLALWEAQVAAYFAAVRAQGRRMTREQLDTLARRYLRAAFDQIEARLAAEWNEVDKDAHRFSLNDEGHSTAGALAHGDYSTVMDAAKALAPEASPEDLRKLCRRLLEVKQETVRAELRALSGEPLAMPALFDTSAAAPELEPKETPKVSEVAKLYGDERVAEGGWSAKTELQNRTILALLANLLGDPPIGDVSKDDIRKLGQDILQLPSNMTKRFPGVPPREVLERLAEDTTTPRLEPRSVNKYRQMARSLFKWAAEGDIVTANPATVLRDVKESKAREDRKPFTDEDLRAYFSTLPPAPREEPFLYWIPRILAYSGMRLSEAAKLQRSDIRQQGGRWVFDVSEEGEGKKLKTDASRRLVPFHPRLVTLGLPEFVQGRPEGFLWPEDMRTTKNPTRGDIDKLSKLLGRKLRSAGVTDPKKTGAHSFRHTVATRLKALSVPDYQIADLIGHEDDSMTTGRYGKATDVGTLAAVIERLILPI